MCIRDRVKYLVLTIFSWVVVFSTISVLFEELFPYRGWEYFIAYAMCSIFLYMLVHLAFLYVGTKGMRDFVKRIIKK